MSKNIQLFYCLSLLFIFLLSCKEDSETQKKVSVISETTIPLKSRVLDDQAVEKKELRKGLLLNEKQQAQLSLSKIDEAQKRINDYPDIQYYCLDTIFKNSYGTALLISRTYDMEDYVWLVLYDLQMNLKDFKTVFYDEYAESAHQIYAQFEDPIITLSEYTMNLGNSEEHTDTFRFSISNKLVFSLGELKQQQR